MTREQAIAYFKRHLDLYCVDGISREAEEMAIKALEQQPCEDWYDIPSNEMNLKQARQAVRDLRKFVMDNHILPKLQSCEDAVSRQAVKDIIHKYKNDSECLISWAMDSICDLPSVTPKRRVGEWKKNEHTFWTCSECGLVNKYNRVQYAYCPNCGAKMVEETKIEKYLNFSDQDTMMPAT